MKKDKQLYWKLFSNTFFLSAFTFGGGYVIISLMKRKFVDDLKWISNEEMLDLTAIAQSSPGAVAVNASILLGFRIAGFLGSIVSIVGTILPPLVTISVISIFYTAFRENIIISAVLMGMQAGVAAVITDVVLNLAGNIVKEKNIIRILAMIGSFIAAYFLNINVMFIILICGFIGALKIPVHKRKTERYGDVR